MGGSDSDALGATSAVNKSNVSESVGDSPSSASDQEEIAILEESSVSTDSGMYSFYNLSWQVGFNSYFLVILFRF